MSSATETVPHQAAATPAHLLAALLAAAVMSEMGIFIMPLLLGGMTEAYGISEAYVGYIITMQIGAYSAVSLCLAPFVHRIPRRNIALAGAGALIAGNLLTAAGGSAASLIAARLVTGIGEGSIQAMMASTAAQTGNPDRTFATLSLGIVIMSLLIFLGMPEVVARVGPQGTFMVIACLAAILLPLLWWLPRTGAVVARLAPARDVFVPLNFCALLGFLLFCMSGNIVWFYVERIADGMGLSLAETGRVLVIASVVALAGPLLAQWLSTRYGRNLPLLVAYLLLGVGSCWVAVTHSPTVFTITISLASAAVMFGAPYHMGLFSALDRAGRLAAAARGFLAVGTTLAPAVAATTLLWGGGYTGIGIAALVTAAIGWLLVLPAVRRGDRAQPES